MLRSIDTCQYKASADQYHMIISLCSSLELIEVKCFLKLTADQVQVFFGWRTHVWLTCCNQGRVVWKPVNTNPRLKKLTEVYFFSCIQMFFPAFLYFKDLEIIQTQNRKPKNINKKTHKTKIRIFAYPGSALNNPAHELRRFRLG